MARVNHKVVKQRLNEKRSKITDRQFFTSRALAGYYEDIAAVQTRRYQYNRYIRVHLYWDPNDERVAWTDNAVIYINVGHKMITDVKGRMERYYIVTGIFAHELGHVLYTDFLMQQTYLNYISSYHWYPHPPVFKRAQEVRNEKDFWDYIKADEKNMRVTLQMIHHIWNSLEDGYVENKILNNFPGLLGVGLKKLRKNHFESIPTVTELIEKEESGEGHFIESIFQMVLSYAKFGELKYGDEPLTDKRIQTLFGMISEIDASVIEQSMKVRLKTTNMILIRCWEEIKDLCEKVKDNMDTRGVALTDEEIEEILSKLFKAIAGGTTIAKGSSAPVSSSSEKGTTGANAGKRAMTRRLAAASKKNNTEKESKKENSETENEGGSTGKTAEQNDAEDGNSETEGAEESAVDGDSLESDGKQKISKEETGRMALTQTTSIYDPTEGSMEVNDEYTADDYAGSGKEIEQMLDAIAEQEACKELESERLKELNEVAKSISYGNVHNGINIRVNRIKAVEDEMKEEYEQVAPTLLMISRQLQRSISKQLKDQRRGGKMTGLMMGRRLDARALHRNDGKVFYKNNLPNETPQLAVGLLLDESGSMSSANRAVYARAAAIILYDFCISLDIPVMVYGHSTGSHTVELYSYAEFESYDDKDRYRLMDIGARGSNRDGAALRYVAERLSKRTEDVKILILVSDGQPSDWGYYGTAAEEDLRGIKQEYQRKDIVFVAAAIGDDKQNIERIYGDSFLDITDLNQLPTKLTNVVKRFIRV